MPSFNTLFLSQSLLSGDSLVFSVDVLAQRRFALRLRLLRGLLRDSRFGVLKFDCALQLGGRYLYNRTITVECTIGYPLRLNIQIARVALALSVAFAGFAVGRSGRFAARSERSHHCRPRPSFVRARSKRLVHTSAKCFADPLLWCFCSTGTRCTRRCGSPFSSATRRARRSPTGESRLTTPTCSALASCLSPSIEPFHCPFRFAALSTLLRIGSALAALC